MLFKALTSILGFSAVPKELAEVSCHGEMCPGLGHVHAARPSFSLGACA